MVQHRWPKAALEHEKGAAVARIHDLLERHDKGEGVAVMVRLSRNAMLHPALRLWTLPGLSHVDDPLRPGEDVVIREHR